jgi:uncharacterized protein (TIGR02246 family)
MSDETIKAILDRHMEALAAGDLDAVMADYTDDSVFISNLGGAVKGLDAIRGVFSATSAVAPTIERTAEHIDGDVAFITWTGEGLPFGTDTFLIRDGKILVQTVAINLG